MKLLFYEAGCGRDRYEIAGYATLSCGSIVVQIYGGERPHLGAIAMAYAGGQIACTEIPKHKEGELAATMAKRVARETGTNVAVTVGIHIDNASRQEIELLCENAYSVCQLLIDQITANRDKLFTAKQNKFKAR